MREIPHIEMASGKIDFKKVRKLKVFIHIINLYLISTLINISTIIDIRISRFMINTSF